MALGPSLNCQTDSRPLNASALWFRRPPTPAPKPKGLAPPPGSPRERERALCRCQDASTPGVPSSAPLPRPRPRPSPPSPASPSHVTPAPAQLGGGSLGGGALGAQVRTSGRLGGRGLSRSGLGTWWGYPRERDPGEGNYPTRCLLPAQWLGAGLSVGERIPALPLRCVLW